METMQASNACNAFQPSTNFTQPCLFVSDFKGEDGGIYVVLSTQDLSLAIGVEHDIFLSPFSKVWVHGSWIRHVYWTISTSRGKVLKVHFNAYNPKFEGSANPTRLAVDDVHFDFKSGSLTVTTPTWQTKATVTKRSPHRGHLRMNIAIQPHYHLASHPVSPHGLLGQTYDTDGMPLHGNRDKYDILDDGRPTWMRTAAGGRITTRSQAEGAIEGNAEMYRIKSPFDTNFTFSRFGLRFAPPRMVVEGKLQRHDAV